MKDHEIRETVNRVQDLCFQFRDSQQLRERIANFLVPVLKAITPSAPAVDGARDMDHARAMWAIRNKDREIGEEGVHQHLRDAFDDGFRAALSAKGEAAAGEPVYQWQYFGEVLWRDADMQTFEAKKSSMLASDMRFRVLYTAPPAAKKGE